MPCESYTSGTVAARLTHRRDPLEGWQRVTREILGIRLSPQYNPRVPFESQIVTVTRSAATDESSLGT